MEMRYSKQLAVGRTPMLAPSLSTGIHDTTLADTVVRGRSDAD